MYVLHYYPGDASLLPHMAPREIGAPFELSLVDRTRNAQGGADYLKMNPNGRIPVLTDDEPRRPGQTETPVDPALPTIDDFVCSL